MPPNRLQRALRVLLSPVDTEQFVTDAEYLRTRLETLTRQHVALVERVKAMETAEVARSAEHAAMVHRLDSMYKRIATRMAKAAGVPKEQLLAENGDGESVLDLKQRLRR